MSTNAGRKIVYFLGAGASLGAGANTKVQGGGTLPIPTQRDFWQTFLRLSASRKNRALIESFLFRYFKGYRRPPARLASRERHKLFSEIDVEEVFTFLSERCRAPSTSASLRTYSESIWLALVTEIGHVFRRFSANSDTRYLYRQLLRYHIRSWDAIVSFNYDTVFEDSLPRNRRWGYDGINARARDLRILKPHGSINWELKYEQISITQSPAHPVIVAPTHLKFVAFSKTETEGSTDGYLDHTPQVAEIWRLMEQHMSNAKALVFIGYSFPVADLYFSSVLRSILTTMETKPRIIIVNPDAMAIQQRLRQRFSLENTTAYFGLEQFCQMSRALVVD